MSPSQDLTAPGRACPQQQPAPGHQRVAVLPAPGFAASGMGVLAVPAGMHYDRACGLTLPDGTELASRGRRAGAFCLAGLLWVATLLVGYAIWSMLTWPDGRTPAQQLLGLRCWDTQTLTSASRGTMFLRGLSQWILDPIALGGLVSLAMFLSGQGRRTLGDHVSAVVVLRDPRRALG
jgi:uncharacterized RDD family membrane protein YckC